MNKYAPIFLFLLMLNCVAQEKQTNIPPIQDEVINYTFETVASDIPIPWGMTWLPDGTYVGHRKKWHYLSNCKWC